ncbi:MAG: hydroxyproline-2-epimerase [Pirellulaceae bacterium]|nr:hydroxyproline-2-epimerase [Pirellulaceae bacterium]
MTQSIDVVDSHTAGEPTRVVIHGGPDLGSGPLTQRLNRFRNHHDRFRTAVVREPRGWDVLVGALLCDPHDETCDAGVIFFNNVGYLGMCGHGMIGVVETLRHVGRLNDGKCRIDTPVGVVTARVNADASVSIDNVPSYRKAKDVEIEIETIGRVVGDVAWGGNWFYLIGEPRQVLTLDRVDELQTVASTIRSAINASGYPEIDHIELFGQPNDADSDSRNFVLCPGMQYDRSPCGTGTSAKLACLAADGRLHPGQTWVQEGILGTKFFGDYRWADSMQQQVIPTITGRAFVTAESKLLMQGEDPFRWGIA